MTNRLPNKPPNMPTQGNIITRSVGRFFMWLWGWRVEGELPNEKKLVIAVGPHTSNWDFFVAMAFVLALGLKVSFLMKHQIDRFPVRGILRWLGGIAVNRDAPEGIIDQAADHIKARDRIWLGIAPAGTRKDSGHWKTGFLRIAEAADVPVMLLAIDGPNKRFVVEKLVRAEADKPAQAAELRRYLRERYRGIKG